jgi:hypothetical protein
MGLFNLFKPAKAVLVIDGVSLNESLGMKGNVPPRTQLQVLRRLSRFAQREKLSMVVVLTGTPLNKAPAGKKFEGITVVYSKNIEGHAKCLAKVASGKGSAAIMISNSKQAEQQAGSRVNKLRVSTFRKAFDVGGNDSDGNERSGGGGNRNRSQRRRQKKDSQPAEKAERQEKNMSDADAINELIDLVD